MSPLVEDARVQCAAFVSALYQEAGYKGLNSINGNQLVNQFGTAYHTAGTGYVPQGRRHDRLERPCRNLCGKR